MATQNEAEMCNGNPFTFFITRNHFDRCFLARTSLLIPFLKQLRKGIAKNVQHN